MAIKNKLTKFLHKKSAEYLAPLYFGSTVNGTFMVSDKNAVMPDLSHMYVIYNANAFYKYSAEEDAFLQLPGSGITGSFGAGACGDFRALGCPGGSQIITATGGSTTTISTNLSLTKNLAGHKIQIISGPGAGYVGVISNNTVGTNAIITLTSAVPVSVTSSTQFRLFTGSVWFFNPGSGAVGFRVYDVATNTWIAKSVTNLPTSWGTDGSLISTGSAMSNGGTGFSSGTTSSSSTTTLADSTKTWPINGWVNCQIRITGGLGAGQIRTVSSNTSNTITVSAAWSTTPDATSTYIIEGNDDFLYLLGNNSVTMYKYTISTDTWSTITPVSARAAAPGSGIICAYLDNVPTWVEGSAFTYTTHHSSGLIKQNGRYIYSFRAGGSNVLDVYDIAANTWYSGIAYGNQTETFTTGSSAIDSMGCIYIQINSGGTMRYFRFDVNNHDLEPLFVNVLPQSTSVVGVKTAMQILKASDGSGGTTVLPYIYGLSNTRNDMIRFLLI